MVGPFPPPHVGSVEELPWARTPKNVGCKQTAVDPACICEDNDGGSDDGNDAENDDQVEGGPAQAEAKQIKARRRRKHKKRGPRKRLEPRPEEGRTPTLPAPPKPTLDPTSIMTRAHLHLASPSALMAMGLLTGLFLCWHWG